MYFLNQIEGNCEQADKALELGLIKGRFYTFCGLGRPYNEGTCPYIRSAFLKIEARTIMNICATAEIAGNNPNL